MAHDDNLPQGTFEGFQRHWKPDVLSGFMVFLIALPLCLGIALACGYPAIAGIFTAIIGGILSTFFSNSELTIKGPAAGLIVIAIGCVTEFGFTGGRDPAADIQAYRLALGVGVIAGVIQILFGVFRSSFLGDFFPTVTIHGLLASIGLLIIAKQFPVTMGVEAEGGPLELLVRIPRFVMDMNPVVALIGAVSLLIMFCHPLVKSPRLRAVPAPVVVLIIAVPMGMYFDVGKNHSYSFSGRIYLLGQHTLVNVPESMFSAITFPDFSGLGSFIAWKYILMFSLIGSLESLLSAKAIDGIDPWRRKTDQNRDLLAVGIGNTLASCVGGLPMISEIVRSRANIDNGARTRFANMYHGAFLLAFVALLPSIINQIPLAALGAMLVRTGFRLASPQEFIHMYRVGRQQLLIFSSTIVGVLATDLLVGIAIGIGVKTVFHLYNGVPILSLFRLEVNVEKVVEENKVIVAVKNAAVFSTWIGLKSKLDRLKGNSRVILDLSETCFVDHTVMTRLQEMQNEFQKDGSVLTITGLDDHCRLSDYPTAALKNTRLA